MLLPSTLLVLFSFRGFWWMIESPHSIWNTKITANIQSALAHLLHRQPLLNLALNILFGVVWHIHKLWIEGKMTLGVHLAFSCLSGNREIHLEHKSFPGQEIVNQKESRDIELKLRRKTGLPTSRCIPGTEPEFLTLFCRELYSGWLAPRKEKCKRGCYLHIFFRSDPPVYRLWAPSTVHLGQALRRPK